MIIGTCLNGKKCVYDLPINIQTIEEFESLIYDYHHGMSKRRIIYAASSFGAYYSNV